MVGAPAVGELRTTVLDLERGILAPTLLRE